MKLKRICKEKSSIFYAFPLIGTTDELYNQPNIPEVTWLLDVYDLPLNFPAPARKSGLHYIDVSSDLKKVAIHSPTIEVNLINAVSLAKAHIEEPRGERRHVENLFHYFEPTDNDLTYITQTFTSPALGALLLPMS